MTILLILTLVIIILSIVCYFAIKGNIKKSKEVKHLRNSLILSGEIEEEKSKIRNEQNEKKKDILNGVDNVNGILSVKPRHDHSIGEPCRENCPAYHK